MRYREKKEKTDEINIAPLIDMVFILLIFFAVSTTFVRDLKLDLERPTATSAERASTKVLRIHVDRNGSVFIDEQPVKIWMLQSRVRDLLKISTAKSVLVIADRLITAEKLVEVVDQCKLGGAAEVGVATEKSNL
jgi:biopolymer transport protein ExbD